MNLADFFNRFRKENVNYGGGETDYFIRWRRRKRISILLRANLSIWLAVSLALLSIVKEIIDLTAKESIKNNYWLNLIYFAFLIVLIIGVIFAAWWEWSDKKLEVSDQEKRFALGIKNMLEDVERIKQDLAKIDETKSEDDQIDEVTKTLDKYINRYIDTASSILCGNHPVDAGILFHDPDENTLTLFNMSDGAKYEPFTIYLNQTKLEPSKVGPAQKAFEKDLLAHMPEKSRKIGWLYSQLDNGEFEFEEFIKGWFEPPPHNSDIYESVISIPISSYAEDGKKAYHGVLNFTTDAKDPFIPRDYVMAFCFASIIAHAKDLSRMKVNKILGLDQTA